MSGQAGETEEYKRLLEFKDILLDSKERLFQVGLSIDSLLRRYNECRLPSTWSLCRLGALIAGVGRMEMLLAGFHQSLRKAEIGEAPLLEENEAVTEVVTSVVKFMRRGLRNFIGGKVYEGENMKLTMEFPENSEARTQVIELPVGTWDTYEQRLDDGRSIVSIVFIHGEKKDLGELAQHLMSAKKVEEAIAIGRTTINLRGMVRLSVDIDVEEDEG